MTVGLNDITIIALASALEVPVVSMEVSAASSIRKKRIPDVCNELGITHLTFNEFLRTEGIII
jgi:hypothetical protein